MQSNIRSRAQARVGACADGPFDRRPTLASLAIFAGVATTIVVATFASGRPIGWGDEGLGAFMYMPGLWVRYAFFGWNPLVNAGGAFPANPETSALLPLASVAWLVHAAGLPPTLFEAGYIWFVHFGALTFSYLLITKLLAGRYMRAAAFVGALAYDLSLYGITTYWRIFDINVDLLVLTPFLLYTTCRLVEAEESGFWKALLGGAVGVLLLSSAFADLAYIVPIAVLTTAFGGWYVVRQRHVHEWRHSVGRVMGGWMLVGLSSAVTLLQTATDAPSAYSATGHVISSTTFLAVSSQSESYASLLRGFAVGIGSSVWAAKDPSWRFAYYSPEFTALAVGLLFVMAVGPMRRTNRGVALSAQVTFGAGIVGAMGLAGPTGAAYGWAFSHVPYFELLRIPYLALAPFVLIGSAIAVACGVRVLTCMWTDSLACVGGPEGFASKAGQFVPVALCAAVVVVYGWPVESGVVLTAPVTFHGPLVQSEVSVPASYPQLAAVLKRSGLQGGCVLVLPLAVNGARTLAWRYGYDGPDDDWLLLAQRVISSLHGSTGQLSRSFLAAMQGGFRSVVEEGGLLGCRYVLLQANSIADVYAGPDGSVPLDGIANRGAVAVAMRDARAALAQLDASRIWVRKALTLYRLPGLLVEPPVYARALSRDAVIPSLRVRAISPTEWLIGVSGGRGEWSLVLNESWAPGWRAFVMPGRESGVVGELVAGANWLLGELSGNGGRPNIDVSGLGSRGQASGLVLPDENGWVLKPSTTDHGTRTVALVYVPQTIVGYGVLVSIISFLLVLVGVAHESRFWHRDED